MAWYSRRYSRNDYSFAPYVPVAQRKRQAEKAMEKLRKKGHPVSPVVVEGRTIAHTFWGKAWCQNLERYSDYANRIPRGRTYVRNGSVVDLQIAPGTVQALVQGSQLYKVEVQVHATSKAKWISLCGDSAGAIDSLVELLQGRFSKGVMERMCEPAKGLFPSPKEIEFSCSCPDSASMCKHIAAVLYGVGARLDTQPELLFRLRKVDHQELITHAGKDGSLSQKNPREEKVIATDDLSELFGLDLGTTVHEDTIPVRTQSLVGKRSPKPGKSIAGTKHIAASRVKPSRHQALKVVKLTKPKAKTKTVVRADAKKKRSGF